MKQDIQKWEDFFNGLSELNLEDIKIPEIRIPNWPKNAEFSIGLGLREYRIPYRTEVTRLWCLYTENALITFGFNGDGSFSIHRIRKTKEKYKKFWSKNVRTRIVSEPLVRLYSSGDHSSSDMRIMAIFVFNQLRQELFAKIVGILTNAAPYHNKAVEEIKKTFEPFIPHVVMDQLSS